MKLTADHVAFSYSNAPVLADIHFQLETGSYVCMLGKNGAGKSTLFQCMLGLLKHYRGRILLDENEVRSLSVQKLAASMAYIPQMHPTAFSFSVLDMVMLGTTAGFSVFGTPGRRQQEIALEALSLLDMADFASRSYDALSGGEKQLVLIARALAQKAPILLMDEPCSGLDFGNQIRVMEKLARLSQEGYLIVQSTHNPEHAFWFADRALVLEDGRTEAFGPPAQVLTRELLEHIYRIPIALHTIPESDTPVCVPRRSRPV